MDKNTKINELEITDEFELMGIDTTGNEVAQKLKELGGEGVILITEYEEVVGFISQNEIVDLVAIGENPIELDARDIMNTDYVEVLEDETLGHILPIISSSYPNAIVVISDDRKCVGFFSKNDYKDALASLGVYDETHAPESPDDWKTKGIALSSQGNTEEAIKCFEKSVETNKNKEQAWSRLARSLEGLNRTREALLCYDKVASIDKKNDKIQLKRGELYSKQKTQNLAIQCYTLALSINPENVNALMNLANEYCNQGNIDKALEYYEKAQEVQGENAEIWYRKGNAFFQAKQYDKAIECYDEAIALDNNYEDALFDKAVALNKLEKAEDALESLNKILKINPTNESAKV
jgi:tetratricopeptide (TPR) repeat protein